MSEFGVNADVTQYADTVFDVKVIFYKPHLTKLQLIVYSNANLFSNQFIVMVQSFVFVKFNYTVFYVFKL